MSTLVQIESAVAGLPSQDQWSLLTWLQGRLTVSANAAFMPRERTPADMKQWLAELEELKVRTHRGKSAMPLQQLMDDIREDRF